MQRASADTSAQVFNTSPQKWAVAIAQQADAGTRVGPLGLTPTHVTPDLPLSDQANAGGWKLDTRLSDEFNGSALNADRWHVNNATGTDSLGRKPALFLPENAKLGNGNLNITFRKQTLPEKYVALGYKDYSSAMVRTNEQGMYGYYEARAKPMNSAGSSAFWLAWTGLPDNATEIDIFEIGGKTRNEAFDRRYNMNAHVWARPQNDQHLSSGSTWSAVVLCSTVLHPRLHPPPRAENSLTLAQFFRRAVLHDLASLQAPSPAPRYPQKTLEPARKG